MTLRSFAGGSVVLGACVALLACAGGETETTGFGTLPLTMSASMSEVGTNSSGVASTDELPTTSEGTGPTTTADATGSSGDASSSGDTSSTGGVDSSSGSSSGGPAVCGDGVPEGDEACDDGNDIDTDTCTKTCQAAKCGDGIVQAGVEACDDGNAVNEDACSNTCAAPGCGDGVLQMGEACDDGNLIDTDACTATCKAALCGDGIVQAGVEACDDGNAVDTDACVAGCKAAACGDKVVQAGVEDCDDGNVNGGDGCSAVCKVEAMAAECMNPTQLTEANRNVTFNDGDDNVEICDNLFQNTWYRFTGVAGVMMPTVAQPIYACGTDAPGWLNGTHPTVNEGVVDRTVCFNWNGNPCNWSSAVQVRNCGAYYVYRLPAPPFCSLRYCGTN